MSSSRRRRRAPGRGQSTSSGSVYMPPDATTITRDGADASSRGRSARVSRNGDKTCVANVSSLPSPVTVYSMGQRTGVQDEHVEAVVISRRSGQRRPRSPRGTRDLRGRPRPQSLPRRRSRCGRARCAPGRARRCRRARPAPRSTRPPLVRGPRSPRSRLPPCRRDGATAAALQSKRRRRDVVADPGEAADDARLQRPVDEVRRGRGRHEFSAACIPSVARAPTRLKMRCMIGSNSRPSPPNASVAS